MTTYWLTTHLGYACRHSGACCTSGWPIPVERRRAADIRRSVEAGDVRPAAAAWLDPPEPGTPLEFAGTLARQPSGACIFHRPSARGGCAIHSARPGSCEHFPYVCVSDPRGVHVTLSHYCPTVAAMAMRDQARPEITTGPPVLADGRWPEGLDARDCLPPPRGASQTLMDWGEVTRWEQETVRELVDDRRVPGPPDLRAFERARAAVPAQMSWPAAPSSLDHLWRAVVAPAWPEWAAVAGRYLAARAHASWALFLGRGVDDVRRAVDLARAVLQVEMARQCAAGGRPQAVLDEARVREALRQTDLLLVHLANPWRLFETGS